jgi:anti-sigma regulatory factor (Ser/Thr protein kinase)
LVCTLDTLSQSFPATPDSVPLVRRAVAEYATLAGATTERLDAIRLAVSEAATNAVVHAYGGRTGQIHLTAAVTGEELWVLVVDDGCGFQTPSRQPGMGVGLALIADASDEFSISQRGAGGTEARMLFGLGVGSPVS